MLKIKLTIIIENKCSAFRSKNQFYSFLSSQKPPASVGVKYWNDACVQSLISNKLLFWPGALEFNNIGKLTLTMFIEPYLLEICHHLLWSDKNILNVGHMSRTRVNFFFLFRLEVDFESVKTASRGSWQKFDLLHNM